MKVALFALLLIALPAQAHLSIRAPDGSAAAELHAEAFGARGDGVTNDTQALQAAIDATAARHGTLILKPGTYLTGSLFLKSGMTLRLDTGVKLLGVQTIDAYPRMPTRIAGIELTWPSALLNVYEQHDVRIIGSGVVDGDGKIFWQRFSDLRKAYEPRGLRWAADYDAERPRLIQIYNSSRVELGGGLTLTRSGFWTMQIVYSHDIKVSGVTIRNNVDGKGPSTDGIDIDSSHHILVENADIDVNDDALCLKAGRDADGLRVNRPTEHVVIRNSTIRSAAAGVTFGSETSGGIHDIEVYGLHVVGPVGSGILFKSAHTRGGTVSNIHIHDLDIHKAGAAVRVDLDWNPAYSYAVIPADIQPVPAHWKTLATPVPGEKGIPHLRDIFIRNITGEARTAFDMKGYAEAPLQNFHFENLTLQVEKNGKVTHTRDIHFRNSRITSSDATPLSAEDATIYGLTAP